jgi:ArsR family transcriptional regulator
MKVRYRGCFFAAGFVDPPVCLSDIDISKNVDIIKAMDPIEVFKALSNESRLQILQWLKEPEKHFVPHEGVDMREVGVCVSQVTEKLNMTQSTVSQYLSILQRAGLIRTNRIGKYTYYKRNEEKIKEIADYLHQTL